MKILGLLLLCFVVFGCAPPFIEELDNAAALARQMTVVGTIGPVNGSNGAGLNPKKFLPVKPTVTSIGDVNVQSGFAISEDGGNEYLQFVYLDSSGQVQFSSNVSAFPLAGADPNYPLYEFDVTATTTTANVVVASPALNKFTYCSASLPSGPLTSFASLSLTTSNFSGFNFSSVVGAQMVSQTAPPDVFNFLLAAPPVFEEGTAPVSSSASVFSAGSSSTSGASLPVTRALYFKSPLGPSYASYFQGGAWVCVQWMGASSPVQLPGASHRIDAVLTSGDLLSTEGGVLRLYDPNGSLLVSVSLGGMQYCYEAYVGLTPYVFFSLAMDLSNDDWAYRVYAVPTSSMRRLGG